jgi:Tfp pilus assembly protein PilX
MRAHRPGSAGFVLLPVMLAMSLIAAIAFLLNRDNGMMAEMVSHQSDVDRARYAAEAGLQALNARIQTSNCSGGYPASASPLINANFADARYSAYANPTSGNSTSLTSSGSYKGSSVTLSRNNVIAYKNTPKTYTLHIDASGTNGQDSYIRAGMNDNNWSDNKLKVKSAEFDSLLQFSLSAFPAGSLPLGATLSLYVDGAIGGGVALYRLSSSWVSTLVTWFFSQFLMSWSTPGGDYHPVSVASVSTVTTNTWSDFDVTDLAAAWLLGRYPNYGVIARSNAGGTDVVYRSGNHSTVSTRPKLAINYLVPCGTTGPSDPTGGSITLNTVADAFFDSQSANTNYGATTTFSYKYVAANDQMRAVLRFDTTGIAPGTLIQSAKLRVDVTSLINATSNPKTISAYALTESWVEGTKTGSGTADGVTWSRRNATTNWTNAGGTYRTPAAAVAFQESSATSPLPGSFSTGWIYLDVTALVQGWVDGVTPNNGVLLISNVADELSAASKENATAANRPQLVITW